MFYRKNIYTWEQIVRLIGGMALALYGYFALSSGALGYLLIAAGVVTAVSGILGFCPACAMVGRKLKQPPQ